MCTDLQTLTVIHSFDIPKKMYIRFRLKSSDKHRFGSNRSQLRVWKSLQRFPACAVNRLKSFQFVDVWSRFTGWTLSWPHMQRIYIHTSKFSVIGNMNMVCSRMDGTRGKLNLIFTELNTFCVGVFGGCTGARAWSPKPVRWTHMLITIKVSTHIICICANITTSLKPHAYPPYGPLLLYCYSWHHHPSPGCHIPFHNSFSAICLVFNMP